MAEILQNPAARAKFLELDALLQALTDATTDVQTVRVSFTFLNDGLVTAGPMIKLYQRRERPAESGDGQ